MSRENGSRNIEVPSGLESELYMHVENFFVADKKCEKTGSPISSPLMLRIFGGTIYPDVYGVTAPTKSDFKIYMAEGKRSFAGRSFDECKGQGISLQRFADYVYLFFPEASWNELDDEEKSEVDAECQKLKLGLLIVGEGACKEIVKPSPNPDVLKEKNRLQARDKIVQYFPDFREPEENANFFGKDAELADNIVNECCSLVDEYLNESFRKITRIKKQSIKTWYEGDTFELYLKSELRNCDVLLIMKPFGSEGFDTHEPTLLTQQRFKSSLLKDQRVCQKIGAYVDECLKKKCIVLSNEYAYYDNDLSTRIFEDIRKSDLKDFSIFERISILGVEKKVIKKKAEGSLQKMVDFSTSLRKP